MKSSRFLFAASKVAYNVNTISNITFWQKPSKFTLAQTFGNKNRAYIYCDYAPSDLQLPLWQCDAGNFYILVKAKS